ncbi:periplakin-like isoform X3 [Brienomyrus brachyistius]|uniref:periplakin-like isoform X3 n=1 Tax=Brienomyrus brachyistius TaxID=42636 RepID=UPI0020B1BDF2|nr:periplakin-like isoform X3 [Brienomyrus brachyistius]
MSKEQSANINGTPVAIKPQTEPTAVTDKVEKTIAEAEQNLATDLSLINEGKDPQYQDDSKEKILESLELLKNLKNVIGDLKHPQAETIKKDIIQLEERVRKLQMDHERMYKSRCLERPCSDDWGKIIEEKQVSLSSSKFGPDLKNMESQMKEHIAFHDEIEAWGPLIAQENDTGKFTDLQLKYDKLLVSSCARHQHLFTLRDYMVRCTVELFWMEQQAEERISNDWSDASLDYPSRQKQYEKFISKCLESKEITVSKLIDDGEALKADNHPAVNVIEAHMEAVLAEWKDFRGLLTCEEKHLRNMEDYHRFHREARDVRDLLQRIDKELSSRYNPEFKDAYQIELLISDLDDLVGAMDQHEKRVEVLQAQSQNVHPLKVRRKMPMELPLVEALCNFHTDQGSITQGKTYTLLSIGRRKWKVLDLAGCHLSAPAVCFLVPPTDPETIALSQSIASLKSDIRENISRSKDILQKKLEEVKKEKPGLSEASQEQLCLRLMANLEKITNDLNKQEEGIYTVLRPPLQQNDPFQDSTNRIRVLKDTEACIKKIELKKKSKVQEAERLLNSHPKCAGASQLFAKVNEANDKCNKVNALLKCAEDKFMNSSRLESSLSTIGELLNTYEMTLAEEQVMPADLSSLERLQECLFTICSDLESKRPAFDEAQTNLGILRSCCEGMVSKVHEHCPDMNRQQAEVHRLRRHQELVNKQVEARSKSLQKAKVALNNYSRLYNKLKDWLCQLPNYEPQDTDNVQQLDAKLKEQRNLIADIARKQLDLQEVLRNAWLYHQAVEDYETQALQLKTFLDLEDGQVMKNINMLESRAPSLKNEESTLEHKFLEASAINKHRLQGLEYALNLLNQNVPEQKRTQDEISLMEGQKPRGIIMRRKLEDEIQKVQQELSDEQRLNWDLQQERELLSLKCCSLETEKREEGAAEEILSNGQDREQDVTKAVSEAGFEKSYRELLGQIREETTKRKQTEEEVKLLQEKLKGLKSNEAAGTIGETEEDKDTEVQQLRNKILDKGLETEKCNLEILKLRDDIQTCKAATLLVRTEEITKEVIQNHDDSDAKQELETLQQQLSQEESRFIDLEKEKLALQLQKTSLLQAQDNVNQQEVAKLKEDPLVKSERSTFPESITNGTRQREALGDDLCEIQGQKSDSDIQLDELEREQKARKRAEMEVQMLQDRLNDLEVKNKGKDEKIFKENVALPQDPQDERENILLKRQIQEERDKRILLEDKIKSLLRQQATQGNLGPSEEGKRDTVLEIEKLKKSLEEERNRHHELNDHLRDVNHRLSDMENMNEDFNKELEEIHTINNNLYQENQRLKQEIERRGGEYQITLNENRSIANLPQSHNGEMMGTQLASLQQELSNLKAIEDKKDQEIEELKKELSGVKIKKEHRENYHRRAIRIIDPNTHQELKPEEAYRWGLIDWTMSVKLQSQECDWEEITIRDPDGESSVLHDKKMGKWYSVEEALNAGSINPEHVQQYHGDEMSIEEFGTMISGRNK